MSHELSTKLRLIQQRNVDMANRLDSVDPIRAVQHDTTAEIARRKNEEIYGPKAHRFRTPHKEAM